MNPFAAPPFLLPENEAERLALDEQWTRGDLRRHREDLLAYVDDHWEDLRRLAGEADEVDALFSALCRIIHEASVNPRTEMRAQVDEVHRHLWIECEKGRRAADREEIIREWVRLHAPAWRRWWRLQLGWVAGRCCSEIAERFRARISSPCPNP